MLTKRIIPCLDVKDGRVVKGTNFVDLKDAGDAVELARKYYVEGADELVFLDISATNENRKPLVEFVSKVAKQLFIPFTVGGGINCIEDIEELLQAGADKVSINSAAISNPELIKGASSKYGRQCIVVAIDAKRIKDSWGVYIAGGRKFTGLDAIEWAKQVEKLGAGELLVTSMDSDGTKDGYDLEFTKKISECVNIPIIASGGAGNLQSIKEALMVADAALAASIFHYGKYTIQEVKNYLKDSVEVRL